MLRIGLLGCGRIGQMHADNVAAHERAALAMVFDTYGPAAESASARHGVPAAASADDVFASADVDAVLVATVTDTHADFIEAAVTAGKPVLCEKPIDLSLDRVKTTKERIAGKEHLVQLGFNRRFDPGHKAARDAAHGGEIGDLHQVIITSRDPGMPPRSYYEVAGGLLRDMTIHDFDLARFMLDEEPVEVFAIAGQQIDPGLMSELKDHDTAMITMRTASGKQCLITNHRSAVYGYDQRVELVGSTGMLQSANRKPHEMRKFSATTSEVSEPYQFFFIERYKEAFDAEIDAFVDAIEAERAPSPGFDDGMLALALAEAAYISVAERRMVAVSEVL